MRPVLRAPTMVGLLLLALMPAAHSSPAVAASASVVISQAYGGGGNSGAPYSSKFVELFNRGAATAILDGWSIQYASASGTGNFSGKVVALPAASVPPGGYFLVELAGGANGDPLPTPDAIGTISPAATAGKLVLASSSAGIDCNGGSNPCTGDQLALIVDLIGYGGSDFFEGSGAAPGLSNTTAALRAEGGCTDSDDNAADFVAADPLPRNSASAPNLCPGAQPSPSPTATTSPTATPTPAATPTVIPTATLTATPTHAATPSPLPTVVPTATPSAVPTATAVPCPTAVPSPSFTLHAVWAWLVREFRPPTVRLLLRWWLYLLTFTAS